MGERKLTGKQIMQLFYTEVPKPQLEGVKGDVTAVAEPVADAATLFRCKCGKTRAQKLKHGYTNLVQHVLVKHPDWVTAHVQEEHIVPAPAMANSVEPRRTSLSPLSAKPKPRAPANGGSVPMVPTIPSSSAPSAAAAAAAAALSVGAATSAPSVTAPVENAARGTSAENASLALPSAPPAALTAKASPVPGLHKRTDYLSWDDYFMSVAFLSAMRSKDPSTQVGACIVSPERKIVGIGYNGFPNGCDDDHLPWSRQSANDSPLDTKYPYVCHAEMNAILNKNSTDVKGCSIYVALFPCNECAKLIIQSGISRVVYCSDKYSEDWKFVASRRLLDMAGVKYVQHELQLSKVVIDFTSVH